MSKAFISGHDGEEVLETLQRTARQDDDAHYPEEEEECEYGKACPYCGGDAALPDYALGNMERYQRAVVVRANCCGRGVSLTPLNSYEIRPVNYDVEEDDWGKTLTKES